MLDRGSRLRNGSYAPTGYRENEATGRILCLDTPTNFLPHTLHHTTPRNDTTVRREMEDVSGRLLFARRFVESVVYSSNRKPLLSGIATTRYRAEPSRLPIIPADSFSSSFYTAPGR
jgi:hypothetical protein